MIVFTRRGDCPPYTTTVNLAQQQTLSEWVLPHTSSTTVPATATPQTLAAKDYHSNSDGTRTSAVLESHPWSAPATTTNCGIHSNSLPEQQIPQSAYGILVSEVMLQQTQVSVVLPYWLKWYDQPIR